MCTHPLLKGFLPVLNLAGMLVSNSALARLLRVLLHATLATLVSLLAPGQAEPAPTQAVNGADNWHRM